MDEGMRFPDTVEEFMDQYKVVDREGIYMSKGSELVPIFRMNQWIEYEKAQLSQEDATIVAKSKRTFVELLVHYPHPDVCTYPEYKGKPYYSIKYIEDGECFVGFGTYNPEVLSQYLRDYFMPSAQPEIIRCKDCEYGEQDEVGRWFCRSLGCQVGNEDGSGFCADAERRTDEMQ